MDDKERALVRTLYEHQVELFNHQGEEIETLLKAVASLQKSHEVIGQMLKITADLRDVAESPLYLPGNRFTHRKVKK
jgi:hypothetical protein